MPVLKDSAAVYLGTQEVDLIYAGSTLVYQRDTTTPYDQLAAQAVARYRLDEKSGTTANNDNGNNGGYVGINPATATRPGIAGPVPGSSISFSGFQTNVTVPTGLSLTQWTLSAWLAPDNTTTGRWSISIADVFGLVGGYQNGFWNIYGAGYPTGSPAGSQLPMSGPGIPDHVVYTRNGRDMRGYLNGVLTVTPTVDVGTWTANVGSYYLGTYNGAPSGYVGTMDEVQIYDRDLTPEEVWLLYSGQEGGPPIT